MNFLTNKLVKWISPTWYKASDLFARPVIKVYFGLWKNDPNLPVWRRGPQIRLVKQIGWGGSGKYKYTAYSVKNSVPILKEIKKQMIGNKECNIKCYGDSSHRLPNSLRQGDIVWNSKIRRKLRKFHLSWIPPIITLPIWLAFYYHKSDIMWKWKFDDIRYEYPPRLTLVLFGISLSITLLCPECKEFGSTDNYYECLLNYLYSQNNRKLTIGELINLGGWSSLTDKERLCYFSLRPEYLLPRYRSEYLKECKKYNRGLKDKFK